MGSMWDNLHIFVCLNPEREEKPMKTFHSVRLALAGTLLVLGSLGCGPSSSASTPMVPVAPITTGNGLSQIDVCQAIPREDMETAMGRKLNTNPEHFEYSETPGETSG